MKDIVILTGYSGLFRQTRKPWISIAMDLFREELFRKFHDLSDQNSYYFNCKREMANYDTKYPLVFKALNNSKSTGVALVHNVNNIHKEPAKRTPQPSILQKILDKAKELYTTKRSPCISLDFGEGEKGNLYLFEFQASHFGINAIIRGNCYYQKESGDWRFVESKPVFERYLAHFLES